MTLQKLVGGRYELGALLGYGGMAEVHRGRDVRLGRDVAVKVLRADLARDPSFQNRFRREAQAAAGLNHPAIVSVYDTGEDESSDGPVPYIVMEYVEGRTLREVLKSEGRLPALRAMQITAEVCAALDFSHRSGIVHRDVKPGNVMITRSGAVKVMDFGIARALADNAATVTAASAVIGTAQYLSPEQARGESVDARSDVYSTGCLLYELLAGHPPFNGDSPVAVAYQHVRETAAIPSSVVPEIPKALDSIVMKALAKNALNRYQSAAEMRTDLQRAIAGQAVEAEAVMTEAERTQYINFLGTGSGARPPAPRPGVLRPNYDADDDTRSHRGALIWAAIVVALLLVSAAGAYAIARAQHKSNTPQLVKVGSLVNVAPTAAQESLRQENLQFQLTGQSNGPCTDGTPGATAVQVTKGNICTQDPPSGQEVAVGSTVSITVYAGPAQVQVPYVQNLPFSEALKALTDKGLQLKRSDVDSSAAAGTVLAQDPPAGALADPGSEVSLSVSNGKSKLPDVRKKTFEQARTILQNAGWLSVSQIAATVTEPYKVGQVMYMDPAQGSSVDPTVKIVLTVAAPAPVLPPCPTPTPTTSAGATPAKSSQPTVTTAPTCTPAG
jgi:beta-lactam-binding protein with PASTA domain/predicted Ser/Thr protein kinase